MSYPYFSHQRKDRDFSNFDHPYAQRIGNSAQSLETIIPKRGDNPLGKFDNKNGQTYRTEMGYNKYQNFQSKLPIYDYQKIVKFKYRLCKIS